MGRLGQGVKGRTGLLVTDIKSDLRLFTKTGGRDNLLFKGLFL